MRLCLPKAFLVLGALFLVLMLSTLVVGPEHPFSETGEDRTESASLPVKNTAIGPLILPGTVSGTQSLSLVYQTRPWDFALQKMDKGNCGMLPHVPAGLSHCTFLLDTLNMMGAPPGLIPGPASSLRF